MKIKLYYMPQTRSGRVRWMLEELGLPYELHYIDLFAGEGETPEYKKIHPHGRLPAIEIDDHIMFESCAICHWLTDKFSEKNLAPDIGSVARQEYEQWIFYLPAMMEPPIWENFLHTRLLPENKRIAEVIPWNVSRFQEIIRVLNDTLTGKDYLVDNTFSTADLLVGGALNASQDFIKDFPTLLNYTKRLTEREAYKKSIAD